MPECGESHQHGYSAETPGSPRSSDRLRIPSQGWLSVLAATAEPVWPGEAGCRETWSETTPVKDRGVLDKETYEQTSIGRRGTVLGGERAFKKGQVPAGPSVSESPGLIESEPAFRIHLLLGPSRSRPRWDSGRVVVSDF